MSQNRDELQSAFELIGEFKSGSIRPGSEVSESQLRLLHLLRVDLLPSESALDGDLFALVSKVAKEDTRWNHEAMSVVNEIYSLRGSEQHHEADLMQISFLQRCPSSWYREIVAAA